MWTKMDNPLPACPMLFYRADYEGIIESIEERRASWERIIYLCPQDNNIINMIKKNVQSAKRYIFKMLQFLLDQTFCKLANRVKL